MFTNMNSLFILLAMIFLHIYDDFVSQPVILNKLKQQSWWKQNLNEKMFQKYQYDYIAGLIIHAISWAFMMMLPIALKMSFNVPPLFGVLFIANVVIHASIDHSKANKGQITLIEDQIFHLFQIIITFILMLHYIL